MEKAIQSKPRYELLDGLRGVAALMVIFYHLGEGFATSPVDQNVNHGYLAVDFFFVLSGFVIGYAYDGRWSRGMSTGNFLLRRVIRLQPMVIIGVLLGLISFAIQGFEKWDGTTVNMTAVALSFVFGLFMLPALPGTLPEVRGNGEMFPLNGPAWSLFFEYIGSIFYALFLHRFSTRVLACFTAAAGAFLAWIALGNLSGFYNIGFGWSAGGYGFLLGMGRMTFSFSVGLLMSRVIRPVRIRGAFWICTSLIVVALSIPYLGAPNPSIANGFYDCFCTLILFPAIVFIGASGHTTDRYSGKICEFLGNISYPVYIIQYPFMYLFYAWLWNSSPDPAMIKPVAATLVVTVVVLAWVFMKYYDTPVRSWLNDKAFKRS